MSTNQKSKTSQKAKTEKDEKRKFDARFNQQITPDGNLKNNEYKLPKINEKENEKEKEQPKKETPKPENEIRKEAMKIFEKEINKEIEKEKSKEKEKEIPKVEEKSKEKEKEIPKVEEKSKEKEKEKESEDEEIDLLLNDNATVGFNALGIGFKAGETILLGKKRKDKNSNENDNEDEDENTNYKQIIADMKKKIEILTKQNQNLQKLTMGKRAENITKYNVSCNVTQNLIIDSNIPEKDKEYIYMKIIKVIYSNGYNYAELIKAKESDYIQIKFSVDHYKTQTNNFWNVFGIRDKNKKFYVKIRHISPMFDFRDRYVSYEELLECQKTEKRKLNNNWFNDCVKKITEILNSYSSE